MKLNNINIQGAKGEIRFPYAVQNTENEAALIGLLFHFITSKLQIRFFSSR